MAEPPGRAHRIPQKVDGGRLINIVGNAVPGVPQVHSTCKPYRMATFGGRNAEDGVPYAPNSIRRAEASDRSGSFTRLPSTNIHQARVWPPALPGDRSRGPNGVIRPPARQNELAPGPAGQGVTDCHSPSGFAMTMVIDGWCFFIGRAERPEFPTPRIPYAPNSIRRADTSDRSGGFCSPCGSHNLPVTSLSAATRRRAGKCINISENEWW